MEKSEFSENQRERKTANEMKMSKRCRHRERMREAGTKRNEKRRDIERVNVVKQTKRDGKRGSDTQTDRQTKEKTDRQRDTERDRFTFGGKDRKRPNDTGRDRYRKRPNDTDRETQT